MTRNGTQATGNGTKKKAVKVQKLTRKRIGRLKTAKDVARYISRCIKKAEQGGEDSSTNTYYKLVTMSSMLLKAIETATFEERIARLEELAKLRTEEEI